MAFFFVSLFTGKVKAANHDFMSTAMSIGVNQGYQDSLENGIDVNWYKFTLTSSGYITLGFDHEFVSSSAICWDAYLYDAQEKKFETYCRAAEL